MAERFKQQLAVIVVVIIGAIFAGPNALQTLSSASPNINGRGELREWQETGFSKGMELYETL